MNVRSMTAFPALSVVAVTAIRGDATWSKTEIVANTANPTISPRGKLNGASVSVKNGIANATMR
jgi:hypothetical protein